MEKYLDLETSYSVQKEKREVMGMLCMYKKAYSLRDDIGANPNVEVEINVVDKTPFSLDHLM